MKKYYTLVLTTIVLSIGLLTGCTELPGRADNNPEQNVEKKVQRDLGTALQQKVGEAAANLEQTVENSAAKLTDEIKSKGISKQYSASKDIGDSSILILSNPVGVIEAMPASGNQLIVSTTIWFDDDSNEKEDRQKIMDNAEVSIQISGDKIEVSTHAKDQPNKDLWSWAEDELDYSDFSMDYVIEIPGGVETYQVTNNVGKVQLKDLQGTYRVISNVGTVNISGATFNGKSTVETDTGSIHLDIANMDPESSLKVKTDVGSLTASLSNSLKCSLDIKSELGAIVGAKDGKSDINGGGPLISLSSSLGSITVDQ